MPEMTFTVRWPDGRVEELLFALARHARPLAAGVTYTIDDFAWRARTALARGQRAGPREVRLRLHERAAVRPPHRGACRRVPARRHRPGARHGPPLPRASGGPRHERPPALPSAPGAVMTVRSVPSPWSAAARPDSSTSWHLTRAGVDHVVFEARTVAHEWADSRWDNFTLVTPNWHCRLPGYAYRGADPDGFMTRDQVVEWLAGYARDVRPAGARARQGHRAHRTGRRRVRPDRRRPGRRGDLGGRHGRRRHRRLPHPGRAAVGGRDRPVGHPAAVRPTTRTPPSCPTGPCSSSAPASPAPRSPRTCTWRDARCTSPSGTRRASPGSTGAGTT